MSVELTRVQHCEQRGMNIEGVRDGSSVRERERGRKHTATSEGVQERASGKHVGSSSTAGTSANEQYVEDAVLRRGKSGKFYRPSCEIMRCIQYGKI